MKYYFEWVWLKWFFVLNKRFKHIFLKFELESCLMKLLVYNCNIKNEINCPFLVGIRIFSFKKLNIMFSFLIIQRLLSEMLSRFKCKQNKWRISPQPGLKISPGNNMGIIYSKFWRSWILLCLKNNTFLAILIFLKSSVNFKIYIQFYQFWGKPSWKFTASLLNWTYVSTWVFSSSQWRQKREGRSKQWFHTFTLYFVPRVYYIIVWVCA